MNLRISSLTRVLFFTLLFFVSLPAAKAQTDLLLRWAKVFNSTEPPFAEAKSLKTDTLGNIYITGFFSGTTDFDPGDGVANLTSQVCKDMAGSGYENDIFLAKYDPNGNYVYAKSIRDKGYGIGSDIAIDGNGNIYVTGYCDSPADFDPSADTYNLESKSGSAAFVACYKESNVTKGDDEPKK